MSRCFGCQNLTLCRCLKISWNQQQLAQFLLPIDLSVSNAQNKVCQTTARTRTERRRAGFAWVKNNRPERYNQSFGAVVYRTLETGQEVWESLYGYGQVFGNDHTVVVLDLNADGILAGLCQHQGVSVLGVIGTQACVAGSIAALVSEGILISAGTGTACSGSCYSDGLFSCNRGGRNLEIVFEGFFDGQRLCGVSNSAVGIFCLYFNGISASGRRNEGDVVGGAVTLNGCPSLVGGLLVGIVVLIAAGSLCSCGINTHGLSLCGVASGKRSGRSESGRYIQSYGFHTIVIIVDSLTVRYTLFTN